MFGALFDLIPAVLGSLVMIAYVSTLIVVPLLVPLAVAFMLHHRMVSIRAGQAKSWLPLALYGVFSLELGLETAVRMLRLLDPTETGSDAASRALLMIVLCGANLVALFAARSSEIEERRAVAYRAAHPELMRKYSPFEYGAPARVRAVFPRERV